MSITHDNHYVPEFYLRHFASASGHLCRYRVLVPKATVAEWKSYTARAVGYRSHLYTRALPTGDSDEIEKWLNKDFETPAAESIRRAVTGARLSREDYRLLSRFVAAQVVRTPAFLVHNLPSWQREAEDQLHESEKNLRHALEEAKRSGKRLEASESAENTQYFPMRVVREDQPDGKTALMRIETVVGRGTWIYAMRHLLTKTLDRLAEHRWTVLSADDDIPWFTTDDPVVRLNFRSPNDYDFGGGWGVPKTNILLPLSPKHLLFTQIGERPPARGSKLPREQALFLRKAIAEHAYRDIFSPCEDSSIPNLRPRTVNAELIEHEKEQWQRWHDEQSTAERELLQQ